MRNRRLSSGARLGLMRRKRERAEAGMGALVVVGVVVDAVYRWGLKLWQERKARKPTRKSEGLAGHETRMEAQSVSKRKRLRESWRELVIVKAWMPGRRLIFRQGWFLCSFMYHFCCTGLPIGHV
jgi:hypothetical protein